MANPLCGVWDLEGNDDKFDDYMKKLDVGFAKRTLAKTTSPTVTIKQEGDDWSVKTASAVTTQELKFKLNEPIDEDTLDGRKAKTTFTLEGGKLVQTQKATKPNEKDSSLTREVDGDKMRTICKCEDVTSVRTYKRSK